MQNLSHFVTLCRAPATSIISRHAAASTYTPAPARIDSSTKAAHPEDTRAGYAEGVTLPLRMRPSTPVIGSGVTVGRAPLPSAVTLDNAVPAA